MTYTPTTTIVRNAVAENLLVVHGVEDAREAFDRWVALRDRKVLKEVEALYSDCAPRGQYERFDEYRFHSGLRELIEATKF
jgi:hypothetical protein